jgi:hypothetical protein
MHKTLLHRIVLEYDRLLLFWLEETLEKGPGSVVLYRSHTCVKDLTSVSEYWTVADLRRHLREFGYLDEFVFSWLVPIEQDDALPAVIIDREPSSTGHKLFFYRIHRPLVKGILRDGSSHDQDD